MTLPIDSICCRPVTYRGYRVAGTCHLRNAGQQCRELDAGQLLRRKRPVVGRCFSFPYSTPTRPFCYLAAPLMTSGHSVRWVGPTSVFCRCTHSQNHHLTDRQASGLHAPAQPTHPGASSRHDIRLQLNPNIRCHVRYVSRRRFGFRRPAIERSAAVQGRQMKHLPAGEEKAVFIHRLGPEVPIPL